MRPHRYLSAEDLDTLARGSALIEDALRLLNGKAPPPVLAHLQFAIDLLRGEAPLRAGSTAARMIDRQFAAASEPAPPAND